MINFRTIPDDHPDLAHSPMLRAALLTLRYAQERARAAHVVPAPRMQFMPGLARLPRAGTSLTFKTLRF